MWLQIIGESVKQDHKNQIPAQRKHNLNPTYNSIIVITAKQVNGAQLFSKTLHNRSVAMKMSQLKHYNFGFWKVFTV